MYRAATAEKLEALEEGGTNGEVKSSQTGFAPLDDFVRPMFGLPAWGVRQGHGSFLTFEFGEPQLTVREWQSHEGLRRSAAVHGQWHLWIYCCHWRAKQEGAELAWSEDSDELIARAARRLNGQKLLAVSVDPGQGRSAFTFDLGGSLETWPYGDDPADEQWNILTDTEVFAYRADGLYTRCPIKTPANMEPWSPLS